MKRFCRIVYILLAAVWILSLSGCDWEHDDDQPAKTSTASSVNDNLMVITSPVLKQYESYKIFRGDKVKVSGTNARYYVAPISDGDVPVVLNLQFDDVLSEDVPFAITTADEDYAVVLSYNPNGTYFSDIATEYGSVIRTGGGTQQLRYNGLDVSGASVEASSLYADTSNEIVIMLDDKTARITTKTGTHGIDEYYFAWHADPYHRNEYYTEDIDGTEELTKEEMLAEIFPEPDEDEEEDEDGDDDDDEEQELVRAYINHDIRYITSDLNFEGIISDDYTHEYLAYYSDAVQEEAAAELGAGFEGPYIFATLPIMNTNTSIESEDEAEVTSALNNTLVNTFASMTHTAEEAFDNPVLHIIESGTYRLQGTWLGQIMLEPGDTEDITIILDNVTISCDAGPAIVFSNARECGPEDNIVSFDAGDILRSDAGAKLIIANRSVNNISGKNVYRILKAEKNNDRVTAINGRDIFQQAQLCKMDGAIHSSVSLAIGAENNSGGGKLNVTSPTYQGITSERHMLIDSGTITVTAEEDGISVNAKDASVFTMDGGNLTITAKRGDGIDSGNCIVLNIGTLDITSGNDSEQLSYWEGGALRADNELYLSDNVTYTHQAYVDDGSGDSEDPSDNTGGGGTIRTMTKQPVTIHDENGAVLLRITYASPVEDEDTEERTIPSGSYVFPLEHRVNSFSGITVQE